MKYGRVLMIDEVDKALTEVVYVLKALLVDEEILLIDGRSFVTLKLHLYQEVTHFQDLISKLSSSRAHLFENIHPVHPDFRVIALANSPGYSFLCSVVG